MARFSHELKKADSFRRIERFFTFTGWIIPVVLAAYELFRSGPTGPFFVCSIYLIILNAILILYIWSQNSNKIRLYALFPERLHLINHELRDALSQVRCGTAHFTQADLTLLKGVIVKALDSIASGFSITTGSNCRACIKELRLDAYEKVYVKTFLRDGLVSRSSTTQQEMIQIEKNTDFEYLIEDPRETCFFCNHLPSLWYRNRYKNSSLSLDKSDVRWESAWFSWPQWPFGPSWPLPYKSTIVVPIRYTSDGRVEKIGEQEKQSDHHYWGFLCVDSPKPKAFKIQYDFHICAALADLLYLYLSTIAQNKVLTTEAK